MDKKKTGIFYVKDPPGVIVMDNGLEVARYDSVAAFVSKHKEGLFAIGRLEENLNRLVESQYTPYPPDFSE
ncbi:MAG: hypothetical protein ACI82A_000812 [Candidatus Azotimanducaceae bacterium]|jgi:hypothetical protein